ncbi:alpha/beta hydrolase [Nocardia sp. alder85J]|uniref:alpha/beta hydrolase n=1 Tax=Nocardia sp. alder85J TaxID=2862949 RepID=UPI001CD3BC1A|nr:alpha/beta hydrolase [Nocardia sp. alder85J]MCX4096852.1 alpha/beta hydrolase [Nocardia sp. alder85J]
MPLRRSCLIAVAAACLAGPLAALPATAAPTALPGAIDLPCAGATRHQNADWYLPDGVPRGLVWVQHGFARADGNVAALAETLASAGYLVFTPSLPFFDPAGCTLQNLGDNTPFLDQVARLFGTADDPYGPLATALAAAAAQAGRPAPALPQRMVFIGHSAGAEAAEYVAHHLHTDYPARWPDLAGLILLDPVKSFLGNNTDVALTDLDRTPLPILTVAGPPSPCNNFGTGTTAVQTLLHRDFVGVRLPTGVHTDAEGASSDALGELICGTPQSANVSILQHLATDWTADFFDGTTTSIDYPTGTPGTIPAAAGAQPLRGAA